MKTIILSLIFSALALISTSVNVLAQRITEIPSIKKNAIEFLFTDYNTMDGSPKINFFSAPLHLASLGISYNRISPNNKWIVNITSSFYIIEQYIYPYPYILKPGDLFARYNYYLTGMYFRNLFQFRSSSLYAGSGLNYRFGNDIVHDHYYFWEDVFYNKRLSDLGLQVAIMEKIDLPFHFMLTGKVGYTRYLYRYDTGMGFPSDMNGTPKNVINYHLGIGYRFGNSTEAEKIARKVMRDTKTRKNALEIYYSISHFFDGTKTNWLIEKPYRINDYDTIGNITNSKIRYGIPAFLGIQYNRDLKNGNFARLSFSLFGKGDGLYKDTKIGEVFSGIHLVFSASYLYTLLHNNKTGIQALGALNYRTGYDEIKIDDIITPNGGWDAKTGKLLLNDIGLSAGLRVEQSLASHLFLSAETKYTRFIYRGSKGIDFNGGHKKAAPNTFTIKLGIGYRF